eukprot:scaffold30449_cov59-Phaeocystis_antarctica.AAC.3
MPKWVQKSGIVKMPTTNHLTAVYGEQRMAPAQFFLAKQQSLRRAHCRQVRRASGGSQQSAPFSRSGWCARRLAPRPQPTTGCAITETAGGCAPRRRSPANARAA